MMDGVSIQSVEAYIRHKMGVEPDALRDLFAGLAMQAYISKTPFVKSRDTTDIYPGVPMVSEEQRLAAIAGAAEAAYAYADAMLKAREAHEPEEMP